MAYVADVCPTAMLNPSAQRSPDRLSVESTRSVSSVIPALHSRDLFLRQLIQLVHQRVNVLVDGLDLPLVEVGEGRGRGSGKLTVPGQLPVRRGPAAARFCALERWARCR